MHYDFAKLVRVSALATLLSSGTLFCLDRAIYVQMAAYASAFVFAFASLYFSGNTEEFEEDSLEPILDISDNVQRFCPFLFGMFVSIILGRWWSIRTSAVGAIADHIMNISGLVVSMGARILQDDHDWAQFRRVHLRFVKYGLASLAAVAHESRADSQHWDEMVALGILSDAEKDILMETTNTAVVLWCWICSVAGELMELLKIPPPNYNVFFQEVRAGVIGIHELHKYLRTQLPFPYVHMITLIVNVNNLVMAVAAGLKFAIAFEQSKVAVCIAEVFQFLLVPLLYQGLLQICVFLSDPMGTDIIDFPIRDYMVEVNDTCYAQVLSTRQLYDMRRTTGTSPLPNAHVIWNLPAPPSPAKAPPVPTPAPPVPPPVVAAASNSPAPLPPGLNVEMEKKFEEVADRVSEAIARGMVQAAAMHRDRTSAARREKALQAQVAKATSRTAPNGVALAPEPGMTTHIDISRAADTCCPKPSSLPIISRLSRPDRSMEDVHDAVLSFPSGNAAANACAFSQR